MLKLHKAINSAKMLNVLCINDDLDKIKDCLVRFKKTLSEKVIIITENRFFDFLVENMKTHSKFI